MTRRSKVVPPAIAWTSSRMIHLVFVFVVVVVVACFRTADGFSVVSRNDRSFRAASALRDGAATNDEPVAIDDGVVPRPRTQRRPKHVVIVGAGWAGYTAAQTLVERAQRETDDDGDRDLEITLLDGAPRGVGGLAGGWRTPGGRPVEAGVHGFWREYRNTFAVMREIGVDPDEVLTDYAPSILVDRRGRVGSAPVLGDGGGGDDDRSSSATSSASLPPPLDVALGADLPSLSWFDRASAINLAPAWADFVPDDPASWEAYDGTDAETLFLERAGVTRELYDRLVSPLLHVLPMCPGHDCSAAAALSCLHAFALQSRGAFDVRWCRGSVADEIFSPWTERLLERGVTIRGSSKVTTIERNDDERYVLTLRGGDGDDDLETVCCDAVVLAVGATAAGRLATASPAVFQDCPVDLAKWRGVTCVAVRLFLGGPLPRMYADAMRDAPVVVCGAGLADAPELEETGFCVYDLTRLQTNQFPSSDGDGAVLELDFFRADALADLDDDAVVAVAERALAAALGAKRPVPLDVEDRSVVRARDAVSHFCVGSAAASPGTRLLGDDDHERRRRLYACGDWIDRAGHASWSTEKAVVTGRRAANAVLEDLATDGSSSRSGAGAGDLDDGVIPVVPDTDALSLARDAARALRATVPPADGGVPRSPWAWWRDTIAGGRA